MKARSSARDFSVHLCYIISGFIAAACAAPDSPAQTPPRKADDDWRSLQALVSPATKVTSTGRRTALQIATARTLEAERFSQAAQQAKDFYSRYPGDDNAAKARKLEVTSSLASARLGKAAAESPALTLAAAYRADKNQLREHRFEVALAADRFALRKKLGGKALHEKPDDDEKLADGLRQEFGPIPEVYGLYAGIAATADMESANRIATKILEMRPPPFAKAAAQTITARYGLVGRPLALRLTRLDGQTFELPASPAASGPTVLYVWTDNPAATPGPFTGLSALKLKVAKDVRWIYVGLGATAAQANAMKARAPFAGTHCWDDAGPRSALAQRLKVRSSPTVFVLNRHGVLTSFGRVDELPALLAGANR